jgi:hypothetical protein
MAPHLLTLPEKGKQAQLVQNQRQNPQRGVRGWGLIKSSPRPCILEYLKAAPLIAATAPARRAT